MEHPCRRGILSYFDDGLLFIKLPAMKHHAAVSIMMDSLKYPLIQMDVPPVDLRRVGNATYHSALGNASVNEASDGFVPWTAGRVYGDSFPTMAVECGNSQWYPALRRAKD